ncbi:MAG: AHH domain-containing protein, partial [Lachnospiraceae bacterium]|nr:AHH domain-containing protein [Lachnospiraceae bacterium]
PIRDTIFASNPELYYKIGNTATMLTVLSLPVGMSMEAAVAVGGSPLRAGITELGKFGISTIAGEVTTDKVTEWTGSEALGIIAGMGTSSLSYGGLSAVDYKVNISGLHGTGGNTRIGNVTGSGKSGSGSIGEGIESGTTTKPNQVHHYATNKSKTYTPQLEEIANRYGLDLDDAWNKDLLPHQGRHPNAYHKYVLDSMKQFDNIAQGDKDIFLKLFDNLKNNVKSNPDMLYKDYWK